ncbi:hypothetical protein N1851_006662 [Merluccius polli]|uniref:Integrase core domain-containing protein n=1 Tax=Merluccius polli TaxID=89951 RepID=A0AA47N3Y3_MERPO|nr:hypothetical protein N1851_006662 [Merluccius polli]
MDAAAAIYYYFLLGMRHWEMLTCLQMDGITMSLSTFRRRLNMLGLFRRKAQSDLLELALFLQQQLDRYGILHGYRFMHLQCIQAGLIVSQSTVRCVMKILDPEGVQMRLRQHLRRRQYQNPGPNFLWHVDGYDKLKPYGICINGAVDGFSRMVIWLHAYSTNSNPRVIAGYFIDEAENRGGTHSRIRTDLGTENCVMGQMQVFLRSTHDDEFSERCYITGSSNHNQRIEQWWGFLRTHHAQYWINTFQDLKHQDHFSGDFLDKNLIQFTCLEIIERELQEVTHLWNCHRIRRIRNAVSPSRRPVVMYIIPQLFGTTDYLKTVLPQQIQICREECIP